MYFPSGDHDGADSSKVSKLITASGLDKNFNRVWSAQGDRIAYYLEKGDQYDQIYLTDPLGIYIPISLTT